MTKTVEVNTLETAIEYIFPNFEGMDEYFKQSEDDFSGFCQSQLSGGIGMQIRNNLGLWNKEGLLHKHFKEVHGIDHADDMSDMIIRGIYKKWNKTST